MAALYYEDVIVGQRFISSGRTVTETDLVLFTMLSGDTHPVHTDAVYAATTEFGQRIVHGPFGIAITLGFFGRFSEFSETGVALLDIRDWRFKAPILVGDTLHIEMTIASKHTTRSGRGIIDRRIRLLRQDQTIVQEGSTAMLIARRAALPEP